jgi:hypothetical protein
MSARISDDGLYRYTLSREWDEGDGTCLFVMLNPSTADATEDDPTIRRCVGFAKSWGYRRLEVGNLFAFRATQPDDLFLADDPVGQHDDFWLMWLYGRADRIVAAWGAHAKATARATEVLRRVHASIFSDLVVSLGTTKDGAPRHPLYVKGDTKPAAFGSPQPGAPGVPATGTKSVPAHSIRGGDYVRYHTGEPMRVYGSYANVGAQSASQTTWRIEGRLVDASGEIRHPTVNISSDPGDLVEVLV